MLDWLTKGFVLQVGNSILAALLMFFGLGCNASGSLRDGTVRGNYQPGFRFSHSFELALNLSSNDLVVIEGDVEGRADNDDTESAPE